MSSSKIKGQGHQGQKTRSALTTSPASSTEWNALAANNVTQAADATIPSSPRGVFAGSRAMGRVGYRCALPRISSFMQLHSVIDQHLKHPVLHSDVFIVIQPTNYVGPYR